MNIEKTIKKSLAALAVISAFAATTSWIQAANENIAPAPMGNGSQLANKPNLLYLMDNSGSMNYGYLPDYFGNPQACAPAGFDNTATPTSSNLLANYCSNYVPIIGSSSDADHSKLMYSDPLMVSYVPMLTYGYTATPNGLTHYNSMYYNPNVYYKPPYFFDPTSNTQVQFASILSSTGTPAANAPNLTKVPNDPLSTLIANSASTVVTASNINTLASSGTNKTDDLTIFPSYKFCDKDPFAYNATKSPKYINAGAVASCITNDTTDTTATTYSNFTIESAANLALGKSGVDNYATNSGNCTKSSTSGVYANGNSAGASDTKTGVSNSSANCKSSTGSGSSTSSQTVITNTAWPPAFPYAVRYTKAVPIGSKTGTAAVPIGPYYYAPDTSSSTPLYCDQATINLIQSNVASKMYANSSQTNYYTVPDPVAGGTYNCVSTPDDVHAIPYWGPASTKGVAGVDASMVFGISGTPSTVYTPFSTTGNTVTNQFVSPKMRMTASYTYNQADVAPTPYSVKAAAAAQWQVPSSSTGTITLSYASSSITAGTTALSFSDTNWTATLGAVTNSTVTINIAPKSTNPLYNIDLAKFDLTGTANSSKPAGAIPITVASGGYLDFSTSKALPLTGSSSFLNCPTTGTFGTATCSMVLNLAAVTNTDSGSSVATKFSLPNQIPSSLGGQGNTNYVSYTAAFNPGRTMTGNVANDTAWLANNSLPGTTSIFTPTVSAPISSPIADSASVNFALGTGYGTPTYKLGSYSTGGGNTTTTPTGTNVTVSGAASQGTAGSPGSPGTTATASTYTGKGTLSTVANIKLLSNTKQFKITVTNSAGSSSSFTVTPDFRTVASYADVNAALSTAITTAVGTSYGTWSAALNGASTEIVLSVINTTGAQVSNISIAEKTGTPATSLGWLTGTFVKGTTYVAAVPPVLAVNAGVLFTYSNPVTPFVYILDSGNLPQTGYSGQSATDLQNAVNADINALIAGFQSWVAAHPNPDIQFSWPAACSTTSGVACNPTVIASCASTGTPNCSSVQFTNINNGNNPYNIINTKASTSSTTTTASLTSIGVTEFPIAPMSVSSTWASTLPGNSGCNAASFTGNAAADARCVAKGVSFSGPGINGVAGFPANVTNVSYCNNSSNGGGNCNNNYNLIQYNVNTAASGTFTYTGGGATLNSTGNAITGLNNATTGLSATFTTKNVGAVDTVNFAVDENQNANTQLFLAAKVSSATATINTFQSNAYALAASPTYLAVNGIAIANAMINVINNTTGYSAVPFVDPTDSNSCIVSPASGGNPATYKSTQTNTTCIPYIQVTVLTATNTSISNTNSPNNWTVETPTNAPSPGALVSSTGVAVTYGNGGVKKFQGYVAAVTAQTTSGPTFVKKIIDTAHVDNTSDNTFNRTADRKDCANAPKCTVSEELSNFANWYAYYRTRMNSMKSSVGIAMAPISDTTPGNGWRIGMLHSSVSDNTSVGQAIDSTEHAIANFDMANKGAFYKKLYGSAALTTSATPTRELLSRAGWYYTGKLTGTDPMQYSCQLTASIMSTDGYWTDQSGTSKGGGYNLSATATGNMPDMDGSTTTYNNSTPFYDKNSTANTMADVAMYYHDTDLRTSALGNCGTNDLCLDNSPTDSSGLKTQKMIFYGLSFGVGGTLNYSPDYLTGGSSDYNSILSGKKQWPSPAANKMSAIDDLWHATVNGRGQFFNASNPTQVTQAFTTTISKLGNIVGAASAAATSSLEPIAGDNFAYIANYRTSVWDGDLQAYTIDLNNGALSTTPSWTAASNLNAQMGYGSSAGFPEANAASPVRNVFTISSTGTLLPLSTYSTASAEYTTINAYFNPNKLTQCSTITSPSGTTCTGVTTKQLYDFTMGQQQTGTPTPFRTRQNVLGDIVNSQPVYVKNSPFIYADTGYSAFKSANSSRAGSVYVGANDGFLHSFDSTTGNENWAYAPRAVLPNMYSLADALYSHQSYVDGYVSVGDVFDGTNWLTLLVGGLGNGGVQQVNPTIAGNSTTFVGKNKYYALDITKTAFDTSSSTNSVKVKWEFPSDTSTITLGKTFGNPIITKVCATNCGTSTATYKWAALVTNGYNLNTAGVLYALDIADGSVLFSIANSGTSYSGLNKINNWVENAAVDNTTHVVYGGDDDGNLWRFDLDTRTSQLMASFGTNQPISTIPQLALVANKKVVFLGTGRYLASTDSPSVSGYSAHQEGIYAIKDTYDATATSAMHVVSPNTTDLVSRTLITATGGATRTVDTTASSYTTMDWNSSTVYGWQINLPDTGEIVNVDPKLQLGVLAVVSNVPRASASNACYFGGYSWLNEIDIATGSTVNNPTTNPNGYLSTKIGNSMAVGVSVIKLPNGKLEALVTTSDNQHPVMDESTSSSTVVPKRVSWRDVSAQ